VIRKPGDGALGGFVFDLEMFSAVLAPAWPFPPLIGEVEFAALAGAVADGRNDIVRLRLLLYPTPPIPPASPFDYFADKLLMAWRELCDPSSYRQAEILGDLDNHGDADAEFTSQFEHVQTLLHDRPSD
jgi:hypothetical protein